MPPVLCFVCHGSHGSTNLLVRHLKLVHGMYPGKTLKLKCVQAGCHCVFATFSGFRKHLNRAHAGDCPDPTLLANMYAENATDNDLSNVDLPSTSSCTQAVPISNKNICDMCASAIAQLQAAGVGQTTVNTFVSSMEEVVEEIQGQAKDMATCTYSNDPETVKKIEQSFEDMENPFTSLNSESKRSAYFSCKWGTVEPVQKVLGVRFDCRKNKTTGTYDQVTITDTFSYVPILETLQSILKNPNTGDIFQSEHNSKDGVYYDLADGLYMKGHPLFSKEKNALQIQLFYDDFESCNPLGSKKGIHKLGGVYFTLRNFPPKFNSMLVNIHLVALFHTQDLKTYGFSSILEPIVRDLKVLETEGIEVPSHGHVHGSIVQVTGDNLGIHCLFGFVESFSARYCCRFCITEKGDFQTVFSEDDPRVILRTKHMHSQHCESMQSNPTTPHVYGVKNVCLLNSLQYFNTTDNFSVDIMHDILEGVAQFELKLLLQYYVQTKLMTAKDLSYRVHSFNYGYTQRSNRPPAIKLVDGSNDLGLNASQSWCFLRHFPLIFGDLVQKGDSYWQLLLLLLQIVNIVFSPVLTEGVTIYLKHLIAEHHKLFKYLFPHRNLLPKHHFMTHYPRCIRNIGPILHSWCMRYEAKHNFFKKQLKSFKNVTMTLAKKHQHHVAYNWEMFSKDRLRIGPGKMSDVSEPISAKLGVSVDMQVLSVKWVKHHGTEYRLDMVVCSEFASEMPVFYQIKDIFVKEETIYLVGYALETICFDDHLHAFKVLRKRNPPGKVLYLTDIVYYKPFDLLMSYGARDSFYYTVPYCNLIDVNVV